MQLWLTVNLSDVDDEALQKLRNSILSLEGVQDCRIQNLPDKVYWPKDRKGFILRSSLGYPPDVML